VAPAQLRYLGAAGLRLFQDRNNLFWSPTSIPYLRRERPRMLLKPALCSIAMRPGGSITSFSPTSSARAWSASPVILPATECPADPGSEVVIGIDVGGPGKGPHSCRGMRWRRHSRNGDVHRQRYARPRARLRPQKERAVKAHQVRLNGTRIFLWRAPA
jgi:hypothetical protein